MFRPQPRHFAGLFGRLHRLVPLGAAASLRFEMLANESLELPLHQRFGQVEVVGFRKTL